MRCAAPLDCDDNGEADTLEPIEPLVELEGATFVSADSSDPDRGINVDVEVDVERALPVIETENEDGVCWAAPPVATMGAEMVDSELPTELGANGVSSCARARDELCKSHVTDVDVAAETETATADDV